MTKRQTLLILSLNLVLSMVVVAFFPRFDWLTVALFFMINAGLYFAIDRFEAKACMEVEKKVDDMIRLLHSSDPESRVDEAEEDDFSKLRDEIVKITSENRRIAQEAENRRVQLTEYTEDIAHQIKTPITGTLLMLDLIDDASDKEALERMGRSMERLLGLSDALLKLAAVDSDVVAMKKEAVDGMELATSVAEGLESAFGREKIPCTIYGESVALYCDKKWTYEALFNLAKNGMEASKERGIAMTFLETNVYKSIVVEDFGEGMDRDTLEQAFRRFYKKDPNTPGFGIGLPMARAIMKRQGGDLLYTKGKESNRFELRFYE